MTSSPAVRTRHPKSTTRANILAKAYQMYLNREIDHGDERLSAVLDQLGYTTGAGYQIWANQAAFREDLKVYVAENIEYAKLGMIDAKRAELEARNLKVFDKFVLHSGDNFLEHFVGQEGFFLSLRFFGMADDRPDEVTTALREAYSQGSWEVEDRFQFVLDRFERRLRPEFEMADLTAAVTALFEGYALRHRVDPDRAMRRVQHCDEEHYAFSVAFLGTVTQYVERVHPSE